MRGNAVSHPIFARLFDRLSRVMERELGERRDELVSGLSGRVLEVGAGNGIGFRRYPATVDEVVALEPEPYLRAKAERAALAAPVKVRVGDGLADRLPLGQGGFDAVVVSLVLCSVPDSGRALEEALRVLMPGGELRFLEHARSGRPVKARVQAALDRSRVWPAVAGGCHCARDPVGTIETAGFRVERQRRFDLGPSWVLTNPHVIGVARVRGRA